jgi:hypothetical protein
MSDNQPTTPEAPERAPQKPTLGENEAEALRLAVGGRSIHLLKEAKHFDADRLQELPLFDRRLF